MYFCSTCKLKESNSIFPFRQSIIRNQELKEKLALGIIFFRRFARTIVQHGKSYFFTFILQNCMDSPSTRYMFQFKRIFNP